MADRKNKVSENVHSGHRARLREHFRKGSLDDFLDHEVLEFLLTFVIPRKNVNSIAHGLLRRFGSFAAVLDAPYQELSKVDGVGETSALFLSLIRQVLRRYRLTLNPTLETIDSIEKICEYLIAYFSHERNEVAVLLSLDALRRVITLTKLSSGATNSVVITRRQIVEAAILSNATSVILAHNHTSGIAFPSAEDELTTKLVKEALEVVNVELLDHIIVAGDDYVSMADSNLI